MYKQHRIGVIVLAYNVEGFIKRTIEELPALVDRIYVVDDGSSDATATVARAFTNSKVSLIMHDRNKGPGSAMLTGCKLALKDEMDIIIKVDGDGQMPSEQIVNLIIPIVEKRADYTKGDRLSNPDNRRSMPKFRLFGNILLTRLTRIASGYWHVNDTQNGFVAISKRALESLDTSTICHYYGYLNDILILLNTNNFRVLDVPMPAKYDREKSSIRLRPYIVHVSFLLLTSFLKRLKLKYFASQERQLLSKRG